MMNIDSRSHIEEELGNLKRETLYLAALARESLNRAVWALKERDRDGALEVVRKDDEMDDLTRSIDQRCLQFLARFQPMGEDLRTVLSIMHMAVDMERIGDYGDNVARVALELSNQLPIKPLIDIPRMSQLFSQMLDQCMEAFDRCDVEKAKAVFPMDDDMDDLESQILRELLFLMMARPERIEQASQLLTVARTLERAGDRVTNIAERVIYICTGDTVRSSRYRRPRPGSEIVDEDGNTRR